MVCHVFRCGYILLSYLDARLCLRCEATIFHVLDYAARNPPEVAELADFATIQNHHSHQKAKASPDLRVAPNRARTPGRAYPPLHAQQLIFRGGEAGLEAALGTART